LFDFAQDASAKTNAVQKTAATHTKTTQNLFIFTPTIKLTNIIVKHQGKKVNCCLKKWHSAIFSNPRFSFAQSQAYGLLNELLAQLAESVAIRGGHRGKRRKQQNQENSLSFKKKSILPFFQTRDFLLLSRKPTACLTSCSATRRIGCNKRRPSWKTMETAKPRKLVVI